MSYANRINAKIIKQEEIKDSLNKVAQQQDSIRIAKENSNNPVFTNISAIDDISVNYISSKGDNQWSVGGDGKYKDVDVKQIYNALNQIHVTGVDKKGEVTTTPGGKEIFELGNFMYLDDTPLSDGNVGGKYTGWNPEVQTGWMPNFIKSDVKPPALKEEDVNKNPNYMGWTAANAFGMGYMNVAGESTFFDTYNNEMESAYNTLTGEDQWYGIFPDSWAFDEQSIGHQLRYNYGEEAFQRAHSKAYKAAETQQLEYIQGILRDNPNSNKARSLMKALNILDKNAAEYENTDNIFGFDINNPSETK
tara:strand:- start:14064 stop:14981 length:918 start_codon:yes stop_codon:yes gene_type:complete